MMIFMLANTICCIVTSVLLNMVDHRQVRQTRPVLPCTRSSLGADVFLFVQGGILNMTRKRSGQVQRDSEREPLGK